MAKTCRFSARCNRQAKPQRQASAWAWSWKPRSSQATCRERRGHWCIKKIRRHIFKTIEDKYRYVDAHCSEVSVDKLCRLLEISRSGYYAWKNRGISARKQHEQRLLRILISFHEKHPAAGLDALVHMIKPICPCSRNTLHRLMKLHNIHSIRK